MVCYASKVVCSIHGVEHVYIYNIMETDKMKYTILKTTYVVESAGLLVEVFMDLKFRALKSCPNRFLTNGFTAV